MEPRLTTISSIAAVAIALCFDGVQLLLTAFDFVLGVGNMISAIASASITAIATLSFFLWFKLKGVQFSANIKKMAVQMATPLIEVIPIVNKLPAITLAVLLTVSIVNAEDRLLQKKFAATLVRKATGKRPVAGVDAPTETASQPEKPPDLPPPKGA